MKKSVIRDRVTTTSESGSRILVNPIPVKGKWHSRRQIFQWILLALYLCIPWININGHPLLLLDIEHRRFSIFGHLFFAHEAPNLFFIAMSFFLWIGLVTALFGRVWCGWACPQTVFIENIFRKIEVWIEGDLGQRKSGANTALKWAIYSGISIFIAHSFLAYFVGPKESFLMMSSGPAQHWTAFLVVLVSTGIILFDFGWFREQFCLIACPYGRFQSMMMDRASVTIAYDKNRNDCIDCFKCVRVCPTGIDIRNGLQFECIGCTACADACDSVMEKIHKPKKLIAYFSEFTIKGQKNPWLRPRTIVYGALFIVCAVILNYRLNTRNTLQEDIVRAKDNPYQVFKTADGQSLVINHFKARVYNVGWNPAKAKLVLSDDAKSKGIEIALGGTAADEVEVQSGASQEIQFFIKSPQNLFKDQSTIFSSVVIQWSGDENLSHEKELKLLGPGASI